MEVHFTLPMPNAAAGPASVARNLVRARLKRDITVPIRIPNISETSGTKIVLHR